MGAMWPPTADLDVGEGSASRSIPCLCMTCQVVVPPSTSRPYPNCPNISRGKDGLGKPTARHPTSFSPHPYPSASSTVPLVAPTTAAHGFVGWRSNV